ncbi:MAG: glycosyltransferase family 9 protein [Planctomycetota bacterium]
MNSANLGRTIVRMPSWLGDCVMAEPALRALHESFGAHAERLSIAAPERWLALFDGRFPKSKRIALTAREPEEPALYRGHDTALFLNGSWRSVWCAWRAGVARRIGFASGGRELLLTDAVTPARERGGIPLGLGVSARWPRPLARPFGQTCAELVAWSGIPVRDRVPRLVVSMSARARANERLAHAGLAAGAPFVLVNAGGRARSAKAFPPQSLARALDELAVARDFAIVIACAPNEEESARACASACAQAKPLVLDAPPVELAELVALCAAARLFLTADSGPRHLAHAFGVPSVVIAGPTDPRHTAEYTSPVRIVRVTVPCGPCHREVCPLAGDAEHVCMRSIDAADVSRAAVELLG